MQKYFSQQLPEGYMKLCSWFVVLVILLVSLKTHPLGSPMTGDEPYYMSEVTYLSHYSFYQSLSQGTSLGYSGVLFILSKIIPVSLSVLMRIFSAGCCIVCCFLILRILGLFNSIRVETKYLGMVFFAYSCSGYAWKALPDIADTLCIFIALLILLQQISYPRIAAAAVLIFLGFTFKPVALFYIPGIFLYLLLNKKFVLKQKIVQMVVFLAVFLGCFVVYHAPGYKEYGRLMLEDKNHYYEGSKRIEAATTWRDKNIYYVVYNPNHYTSEWLVSFEEVAEFKKNNPGKLELSYTQFAQKHFDVLVRVIATKIFLDLPYYTDCGMFYHKWTSINKWIKNMIVIEFIALAILLFFCFKERKFILSNPTFVIPLLYYVFLSLYSLIPLQDNWLIPCIVFFSLPIYEYLQKKVGAYILLIAQLVVVFL